MSLGTESHIFGRATLGRVEGGTNGACKKYDCLAEVCDSRPFRAAQQLLPAAGTRTKVVISWLLYKALYLGLTGITENPVKIWFVGCRVVAVFAGR